MTIYIQIPEEEFKTLERDADLLECLREAGVDNWDGWDFALEQFHEIHPED